MPTDDLFRYLRRPTRRRLARVMRAHYRYVWQFALRVTGNEGDASDIAQEVFLRLLLEPPKPEQVTSPRGYLAWQVLGRVSRLRRAVERRRRREEEHALRLAAEVAPASDVEAVREALALLPDEDREALELKYLAGLSTGEIASICGIGERAVRLRLTRAREKLCHRLTPLLAGLFVVGSGSSAAAAPPPDLLPRLLRVAELGEALAPSGAAAATASTVPTVLKLGGVIMSAKKIAVVSVTVAVLIVGGVVLLSTRDGGDGGSENGPGAGGPVAATGRDTAAGLEDRAASPGEESVTAVDNVGRDEAPPGLQGRILQTSGDAVAGAEVWALDMAAWTSVTSLDVRSGMTYSADADDALQELRAAFESLVERAPRTHSEPDGRYALRDLESGRYRLVILSDAHTPHAETLVEYNGSTPETRDVVLFPGGKIAGRVIDAKSRPVEGVEILWRESGERPLAGGERLHRSVRRWEQGLYLVDRRSCHTDSAGHFEISSLGPHAHDLAARKPGYLPATSWNVSPNGAEVLLVLDSGSSIAGRLVDEESVPVAGARIEIAAARSSEVHRFFDHRAAARSFPDQEDAARTSSDESGRFRLGGLTAGPWDLHATAHGFAPVDLHVDIGPGEVSTDLGDIVLATPRAIAGRIERADGRPLSGARVWAARPLEKIHSSNTLARYLPDAIVETTSGPDGAFRLDGLSDGVFEILADHAEYALAIESGIEAGTSDLVLRLEPGLTIRGQTVRGDTGEPVEGVTVRVGHGLVHEARSDAEGRFVLLGLSLQDTYRGRALVRAVHEAYDDASADVSLQGPRREHEVVLRLTRNERIHGKVVDEGGVGVGGAYLFFEVRGLSADAVGYNPARGLYSYSAADGSFSLAAPANLRGMIGDIRLSLVASREGFAPARFEFPKLPPTGQPWPDVDLMVERGVRLEGVVRDATGRGVAGVQIEALFTRDAELVRAGALETAVVVSRALSGAGGRFELRRLPLGGEPVSLFVRCLGYAPRLVDAPLSPHGDHLLEIELAPGGTLAGRVVDQDGVPVASAEVVALPMRAAAGLNKPRGFSRRMGLLLHGGLAQTRSGPGGGFEIRHLPDEAFALVARSRGYEPVMVEDLYPAEPAERVDDIVLTRFSAIDGRVLDARTGAPVRTFTVLVVNTDIRKREQERAGLSFPDPRLGSEGSLTIHDPDGRFLYDGLRPGPYEIVVTAPDHAFAVRELELAAAEERQVEIPLEPGGAIEVRVVDSDSGRPVVGAMVQSFCQGRGRLFHGSRGEIFTDEEGRALLPGLSDGEYFLSAEHPFYRRAMDAGNTSVEVHGNTVEATVSMQPAGRLEGTLTGLEPGSGEVKVSYNLTYREVDPVDDAEGSIARRNEIRRRSIWVRPDGRYEKDAVAPGTYRLILIQQRTERGESIATGPTTGFSANKPVGPPVMHDLGEFTIRAGETTEVNRDVEVGEPESAR